jgi:hypothetical protein
VAWLSGGKGAGGKAQQQKPDLSFIDEMIRRSEEKEKRKQEGEGDGDGTHSDDEFCLAEYESEDEDERPPPDATATSRGGKDKKGDKSKREMLKGLYLDSQEDDEADGEGEEELHVRKVCTHHTLAFEVAHSRPGLIAACYVVACACVRVCVCACVRVCVCACVRVRIAALLLQSHALPAAAIRG